MVAQSVDSMLRLVCLMTASSSRFHEFKESQHRLESDDGQRQGERRGDQGQGQTQGRKHSGRRRTWHETCVDMRSWRRTQGRGECVPGVG